MFCRRPTLGATISFSCAFRYMGGNVSVSALTSTKDQLDRRQILNALKAFKNGDFSVRIENNYDGLDSQIADTFNQIVELNDQATREFERLSRVVGKDGKISERGHVRNATGKWESAVHSVNQLIEDMVQPVAEVARVIGAVAKGDLSQHMMVEIEGRPLRGEFLRIGKIVNTMVGQLASFASEVTRVAREVGTEGKLGGQARVRGVAGTWKDLDRQRQCYGNQPDWPGAQHSRGYDGGSVRGPFEEDHRRREG